MCLLKLEVASFEEKGKSIFSRQLVDSSAQVERVKESVVFFHCKREILMHVIVEEVSRKSRGEGEWIFSV